MEARFSRSLGGGKTGRPVLKLPRVDGDFLGRNFEDAVLFWRMSKDRWISFRLDGSASVVVLRGMAGKSRDLILASLAKKARAAMTGPGAGPLFRPLPPRPEDP